MTEDNIEVKKYRDDTPYKEDPKHKKVCEYIAKEKKAYFESEQFQDYRKKVFVNEHLVKQKWRKNERKHRFGFKLALGRAFWEYEIARYENTFDVDEWISVRSKISSEEGRDVAKGMERFANNVLDAVGYTDHVFNRMRYIPTCGWSVSYTDFHYQEGWKVAPQAEQGAIGGIEYLREYDTLRNQPRSICIHPLNTFQSLSHSVWESPHKGFVRRWYISDVVDAMSKADVYGKPLYNIKVLEAMKQVLEKGDKEADSHFFNGLSQDEMFARSELHIGGSDGNYIDVAYRIGSLGGCKGYRGDPNEYIIECTEKWVLRMSENPADNYSPINHIQSNPMPDSPFPLTSLDKMVPHIRINDLMVNYSVETAINDMTRFYALREDSFLNPERFKNPHGVLNILYVDDGIDFFEPKLIGGDQRSGGLDSASKVVEFLDRDRQRSGITDQEMGIQGDTQDKTATSAQILKASASETKQATIRRFMRQGLLDEMRYIVLLAITHYEPEQLKFLDDEGEKLLDLPHVQMWLSQGVVTWRDAITRDKERDNVQMLEWAEFVGKFLQNVAQPEYSVKLARALGQNKNVPQDIIDGVVPDTEIPMAEDQLSPSPQGQPMPPGAPPMSAPEAPPQQPPPAATMPA